jgi:hypothetical protein
MGGSMRFSLVTAAIVALLLTACIGPTKSTSETGSAPPVGTPHATGLAPSSAPPTLQTPENTLIETPEYTGVIISQHAASEFSFLFDKALTGYWEPSSGLLAAGGMLKDERQQFDKAFFGMFELYKRRRL